MWKRVYAPESLLDSFEKAHSLSQGSKISQCPHRVCAGPFGGRYGHVSKQPTGPIFQTKKKTNFCENNRLMLVLRSSSQVTFPDMFLGLMAALDDSYVVPHLFFQFLHNFVCINVWWSHSVYQTLELIFILQVLVRWKCLGTKSNVFLFSCTCDIVVREYGLSFKSGNLPEYYFG